MQPRESALRVNVRMNGNKVGQYVPVMRLRLVVDGKAESVPPVDGAPDLPKVSADVPAMKPPIPTPDSVTPKEKPEREMTLAGLASIRDEIRRDLAELDYAILMIEVRRMLRESFGPIKVRFDELDDLFARLSSLGSPDPKGELVGTCDKMRRDMERATQAAQRLAEKGRL